jgi:hypothetical protein
LKAAGELLIAASEGKEIRTRSVDKTRFCAIGQDAAVTAICSDVAGKIFDPEEWRIAEPPKFVPWETVEEVPVGEMIVMKECGSRVLIIGAYPNDDHGVTVYAGDTWFTPKELFEDFTFKGITCGKAAQS